jgi:dynein cytoplasmic 1 light intermediate chain
MDLLEREMGYKEELFDFIQQFLRTILLKRISLTDLADIDGASLHYLSPGQHQSHLALLALLSPPLILQPLLPAGTHPSLLQPNVVDRDRVFVPSGWDSWGKIRVLRDGFDVEGVCSGWSEDISSTLNSVTHTNGGALEVYEDTVADPRVLSPVPRTFSHCRPTQVPPLRRGRMPQSKSHPNKLS